MHSPSDIAANHFPNVPFSTVITLLQMSSSDSMRSFNFKIIKKEYSAKCGKFRWCSNTDIGIL